MTTTLHRAIFRRSYLNLDIILILSLSVLRLKLSSVFLVSAVCPLRTPYYTGFQTCKDSGDCGTGGVCCMDMAGRHYCHQLSSVEWKPCERQNEHMSSAYQHHKSKTFFLSSLTFALDTSIRKDFMRYLKKEHLSSFVDGFNATAQFMISNARTQAES